MKRIVCLIALIVLMACPLWAADVKISELPVVTETTPATDVVPVNASGVTSQITVTNLLKPVIASSISDSDLTHCPDGNSVFDALALKAPSTTLTAGADASKGNCTDGAAFYYGTDTHILYHCSATNTWTQVYGVGADGSYQMTITNNTSIAPAGSAMQLYPEGNVWKLNNNGTEKTMGYLESPSFTTPNIGAATGTSLALTGELDGLAHVEAVNGKTIDKLSGLYVATGTSNFIVPTPSSAGGNVYCFKQANAGTSAITVIPVHTSGVQLGKTDNSAYCTADDKLVSGGAATDQICMIAIDATHYLTTSSTGTWTCTAH